MKLTTNQRRNVLQLMCALCRDDDASTRVVPVQNEWDIIASVSNGARAASHRQTGCRHGRLWRVFSTDYRTETFYRRAIVRARVQSTCGRRVGAGTCTC
jgi:hypothetical protein